MPVPHERLEQETVTDPGGTYSGSLTCACGWTGSVSQHPNRQSAEASLEAVWALHAVADP